MRTATCTYRIKMRMPGPYNVGWRTVPRTFETREEAVSEAARLTAAGANLAGWEVKIEAAERRAAAPTRKMVLF